MYLKHHLAYLLILPAVLSYRIRGFILLNLKCEAEGSNCNAWLLVVVSELRVFFGTATIWPTEE